MIVREIERRISSVVVLQVQLQNLITSKFIAHFLEEVSAWQTKLCRADQVITMWFEVQRTWTHLESIFMSSEDIKMQLPEDSQRFSRIDADFKVGVKFCNIKMEDKTMMHMDGWMNQWMDGGVDHKLFNDTLSTVMVI
jgi:Dynein heavy chain, N-terminal region 2.